MSPSASSFDSQRIESIASSKSSTTPASLLKSPTLEEITQLAERIDHARELIVGAIEPFPQINEDPNFVRGLELLQEIRKSLTRTSSVFLPSEPPASSTPPSAGSAAQPGALLQPPGLASPQSPRRGDAQTSGTPATTATNPEEQEPPGSPVLPGMRKKAARQRMETTFFKAPPAELETNAGEQDKMRKPIIEELLATERSYLSSISSIVRFFLQPLSERAKDFQIPLEDIPRVFANIEKIAEMNTALLADMEREHGNGSVSQAIAAMVPTLTVLYAEYVSNHETQLKTLERWMQRPAFVAFLEEQMKEMSPSSEAVYHKNVGLPNLLIMPVQRLPRYVLLIQELLKNTPVAHQDWNATRQADEALRKAALEVNVSKSTQEHLQKLMDVEKLIVGGAPGCPSLPVANRRFVAEAQLAFCWDVEKHVKKKGYFFLLSDMVLYCESVVYGLRSQIGYHYIGHIDLDDVVAVKDKSHSLSSDAGPSSSSSSSADSASGDDVNLEYRHCFSLAVCASDGQTREFLMATRTSPEKDRWFTLLNQQLLGRDEIRKQREQIPQAKKTGHLYKRGDLNTKFKKRFFELAGENLKYYATYIDTTKPLGTIHLPGFKLIPLPASKFNRENVFELAPVEQGRSYFLQAWNEQEMQEWIDELGFFVHSTHSSAV
ncbi:MAG: hypothetical protein Q8P67_29225 [archaeon]|nr:hypothetical protein [archaeon]